MSTANILAIKTSTKDEAVRVDKTSTPNVHYYGFAQPGTLETEPKWLIQKATVDGTGDILKIEFANGRASNVNIWTARVGLTYF